MCVCKDNWSGDDCGTADEVPAGATGTEDLGDDFTSEAGNGAESYYSVGPATDEAQEAKTE